MAQRRTGIGLRGLLLGMLASAVLLGGAAYGEAVKSQADIELRQRLSQTTVEERAVMEELFQLSSEISFRETEISQAEAAISTQQASIAAQQVLIEDAAARFDGVREMLGTVLRGQQRSGAASKLEILLAAEDLKDLMRRINLLRDLTRATHGLLAEVNESKDNLEARKRQMDASLKRLETQREELKAAQDARIAAREKMTAYLTSLKTDRERYEADLKAMEARWKGLKPLFTNAVSGVNRLIAAGGLPEDTVSVSVSLFGGAKGYIRQDRFNAALADEKQLPPMVFGFHQDTVTLDFPGYEITLRGQLKLKDPQTLEYVVAEGTFYGLPLSDSALRDLFSQGDLVFSLKAMIGNTTIRRIETRDGVVELQISLAGGN